MVGEDEEISTLVKIDITKIGAKFQLVDPHNYAVNASERAIQVLKNRFISGLCPTHPDFPVFLWDCVLPQGLRTLNIIQNPRTNKRLSAEAYPKKNDDFNKHLMAPPGKISEIFVYTTISCTLYQHGTNVWGIGYPRYLYWRYTNKSPPSRIEEIREMVDKITIFICLKN